MPKLSAEQIAKEYADFKKQHPEAVARLPAEFKQRVKKAYEDGVSISEIAKACKKSNQAVMNWLGKLKKKDSTRKGDGTRPISASKPNKILDRNSARIKGSEDRWVKIRVDGKEIEIRDSDYKRLYM